MWSPAPLPRTLGAALRDVEDPRASVRLSALTDLARHANASPHAVAAAALAALEDASSHVRAHAAAVLGACARLADVPPLTRAVDDEDALVRQMALEALGEIGGADALAVVSRGLADPRPDVRFQALIVVARGPDPDAAERAVLAGLDDDDDSIRHIALRAAEERWQRGGPPDAVLERARARLSDQVAEVRVAAAVLLAEAGDHAGASVLLDVVEDRSSSREVEDVRAAIERAGRVVGPRASAALERRAFGAARFFRERHAWSATVALASLGHERAVGEVVRALASRSRGKREVGVAAVGVAGLSALRARVEQLRAEDRVDPGVADEALSRLDRVHSAPR
ncbi:MAG: HEAT repeat domain-containing protein [Polyangiaceae bacterium]|nr:HEAT repeat domain-containing protein [Polyangiaceae bacterium]